MRGFWCDIANGPYHSFGTWAEEADAPRLFVLRNREHVFTAVDLAKHNITARAARTRRSFARFRALTLWRNVLHRQAGLDPRTAHR